MSCMTGIRRGLTALGVAMGVSTSAMAGGAGYGFNIDVNRSNLINAVPDASYDAAAGQPGTWNVVWPDVDQTYTLRTLDGQLSGVTMRQTMGPDFGTENCVSGGIQDLNWNKLMCDRQSAAAGVVNQLEWTIEGLPAGRYDLYTYSCDAGDSFAPSHNVGVFVGNTYTGTSAISGAVLTQQFLAGRTHDERTIVVDPGESVRVRIFDSSGEFGDEVFLNGIQIVRAENLNASISGPGALACVEGLVDITGSAGGGSFESYRLEYSPTGNDPWMTINQATTSVSGGVLGTWDTSVLSEGYYTLRLTVQTETGFATTAVRTVYVNRAFDTVDVRSPVEDGIYGGKVCFDGTVWDQCFDHYTVKYSPGGSAQQFDVDPGTPVYGAAVVNDPIASWDASGLSDGVYNVRVEGQSMGGATRSVGFPVVIDNTPPTAVITDPQGCTFTCADVLEISGFVFDEHIATWVLQYADPATNNWVTIASGDDNAEGVLAEWDVSDLEGCCYALRLVATDKSVVNCGPSRWRTEFVTTVYLGNPLDTDGDGVIGSFDLAAILAAWGPACP